jgi:hypothetical protein
MEIRFKLVVVATKTYGCYTYKILNRLQGDNPIVETGNFNLEDPGLNSKMMGGFFGGGGPSIIVQPKAKWVSP